MNFSYGTCLYQQQFFHPAHRLWASPHLRSWRLRTQIFDELPEIAVSRYRYRANNLFVLCATHPVPLLSASYASFPTDCDLCECFVIQLLFSLVSRSSTRQQRVCQSATPMQFVDVSCHGTPAASQPTTRKTLMVHRRARAQSRAQ
ncbi:hypothetical protein M3J09_001156 [Ascochyta lentis]